MKNEKKKSPFVYALLDALDALKRCLPLLLLAALVMLAAVFLWPMRCDVLIQEDTEAGDTVSFAVSSAGLTETDAGTKPTLDLETWLVDAGSDEYQQILEILGQYSCHRKFGAFEGGSLTGGSPYLTIVNTELEKYGYVSFSSGKELVWNGVTYTLYGSEDAGQQLVGDISAILQTLEPASATSTETGEN